jgi:N6-adenosine-specific RNA methylase IME4
LWKLRALSRVGVVSSSQLALGLDVRPPVAPDEVRLLLGDVREALELADGVGLVHADPPWSYGQRPDGVLPEKRAAGQYTTTTTHEIAEVVEAAFEVAAPDCYLVLWSTFPTLREWFAASSGLSWEYVSGGAWTKYRLAGRELELGSPGIGYHWRGDVEPVLLYRKGRPRPLSTTRNAHVGLELEAHLVALEARGRHSEKPLAFLEQLVEAFSSPGAEVLDLYSGLAPLSRACLATGRRYLGAEIDPERHAAALSLLAQGRAKPAEVSS